MKIVIAGIRYFDPASKTIYEDYAFVANAISVSRFIISEVICGKAIGVDTLGETWALSNDVEVKYFPANWSLYNKAAGPIRNKEMAIYADAAIIIWDGKSAGTFNMIQNMISLKKPYELHIIKSGLEEFFT